MDVEIKYDRNKAVHSTEDYWVWQQHIEDKMPYIMLMDISKTNPALDACKAWLYEQGRGVWALEVMDMKTVRVRCSDKNDALMVKLKFGGK